MMPAHNSRLRVFQEILGSKIIKYGYIWEICTKSKNGNHNIRDGEPKSKMVAQNARWRLGFKIFGFKIMHYVYI